MTLFSLPSTKTESHVFLYPDIMSSKHNGQKIECMRTAKWVKLEFSIIFKGKSMDHLLRKRNIFFEKWNFKLLIADIGNLTPIFFILFQIAVEQVRQSSIANWNRMAVLKTYSFVQWVLLCKVVRHLVWSVKLWPCQCRRYLYRSSLWGVQLLCGCAPFSALPYAPLYILVPL